MKRDIPMDRRIIFALDVRDASEARKWVYLLGDEIKVFKVGLELFLREGFVLVDEIIKMGFEIMLDLKLYDIPNTVYGAVKQVVGKGVTYLTVHGNREILMAACEAAEGSGVGIVAVTLLTSIDKVALEDMGYAISPSEVVLRSASVARECGCMGVVASGQEVPLIRSEIGADLIIITPGIRPSNSRQGDQKRVVTPVEAIKGGADHLVIGRPIREAPDPIGMVKEIKQDISQVLLRDRTHG